MKLIFLTYLNRSGSTYLANLFSRSPEVLVCPEGDTLMNELLTEPEKTFPLNEGSKRGLLNIFNNDPKLKWWHFVESDIQNIPKNASNLDTFVHFLSMYQGRVKPDAKVILFKAERLIYLFDRLYGTVTHHTLYFLSIIRDCRGVYTSQQRTKNPDTRHWMSRNPVQTAIHWNQHVKKSEHLKRLGMLTIIRYEDLIIDFDNTFQKVLKKVNISTRSMLNSPGDLFDRLPALHKEIHQQIDFPPLIDKCKEWQSLLKKKDREIIERISGELLVKMGYDQVNADILRHHFLATGYYYTTYYYIKIVNKIKFLLSLK